MGHMILFKNSLTFKSKIKQKLLPVSHIERYAYCFWIRCKHDSKSKETTETNKHTKWPADPKAHIHKIRTTFDNLTCKVVFKWHMKILLIKKFKSFKSHIEIPSEEIWIFDWTMSIRSALLNFYICHDLFRTFAIWKMKREFAGKGSHNMIQFLWYVISLVEK